MTFHIIVVIDETCRIKSQFYFITLQKFSQEEYEGMVEWLKHHTNPPKKVKEYIEKTATKRASWI